MPVGKLVDGPPPVLLEAVVENVTVTGVAALPARLTDPGKLQSGAGVSVGVMPQVRFTVPVNDLAGVSAKLNVALCPAVMVDEFEAPEAIAKVKSGGTGTVELRSTNMVDIPLSMIKSGLPSPFISATCTFVGSE